MIFNEQSKPYDAALGLLSAQLKLKVEIAQNGDEALAATAIVLIGAGFDQADIVRLINDLLGQSWADQMDRVLSTGCSDPRRPWAHIDDAYALVPAQQAH